MTEILDEKEKVKVIVNPPQIEISADLDDKIYELRCKRDAVSLNHQNLKERNDGFNKTIIILSLSTAFIETLKSTLHLTDSNIHGSVVSNTFKIAPIAISTVTAVISSLMKFRKFPERMEILTKATEKFNHALTRMRRLQEELNFVNVEDAKKMYINEVMEFYRDSLQENETTIYPDVRQFYFKKAQKNIVIMAKNEAKFKQQCKKYNLPLDQISCSESKDDEHSLNGKPFFGSWFTGKAPTFNRNISDNSSVSGV